MKADLRRTQRTSDSPQPGSGFEVIMHQSKVVGSCCDFVIASPIHALDQSAEPETMVRPAAVKMLPKITCARRNVHIVNVLIRYLWNCCVPELLKHPATPLHSPQVRLG